MIKAFIFDIGDSIEPSTRLEIESLNHIKKEFGLPKNFVKIYLEADKYHRLHMHHAQGDPRIMRMAMKKMKSSYNYKEITRRMQKIYWSKLYDFYMKDKKGKQIKAIIKFLRNQNYKVGLLSDNSFQGKRRSANIWRRIGVKFDSFVVSEEVGVEKPNRRLFKTILNRLRIKPEKVVYFGNSLKRDAVASKYGWDFVWVFGYANTDSKKFKGKKTKYINLEFIKKYINHKTRNEL